MWIGDLYMNLTKEKKCIQAWIDKEHYADADWMNFNECKKESYWKKLDANKGIEEYDFSNLIELEVCLDSQWSNEMLFQDIKRVIAVSVIKAQSMSDLERDVMIPDYVYVF